MDGVCDVNVVLLCKGPGADAKSYKPHRDESQWWSRRDALVRCAAAFFFGPRPDSKDTKRLICCFDEDNARLEMTVSSNCTLVPTEKCIVSLWKKAASAIGQSIAQDGMNCKISVDNPMRIIGVSSNRVSTPSGMTSKRNVLEYLQKNCTLDFLRSKGLNSNTEVLLRKTNKKALMKVLHDWLKITGLKNESSKSVDNNAQAEEIFSVMLEEAKSTYQQVYATILHETGNEFPCFNHESKDGEIVSDSAAIYLFLGAVRDMSKEENSKLQITCDRLGIPLSRIRFGTVPEFTSKILSVLAFHHAQGCLLRSIEGLCNPIEHQRCKAIEDKSHVKTALNIISYVPIASTDVTVSLQHRDKLHWNLVRIIVSTLWRSKFASSKRKGFHSNSLRLLFLDDVSVFLTDETFVLEQATKHHAAPCEHQILSALIEQIKQTKLDLAQEISKRGKTEVAERLLKDTRKSCPVPIKCILFRGEGDSIVRSFYKDNGIAPVEGAVVVFLDLSPEASGRIDSSDWTPSFVAASSKLLLPITHQKICSSNCQDWSASTITMLQHFLYQRRVFIDIKAKALQKKRKR